MTDRLTPSMRILLTRRNVITTAGTAAVTVVLGRSVFGKDNVADYHVDDSDHDDDHGDDHDKDDIRPSGTVPPASAEVLIDDDDADGFQPGTVTIDLGETVTWVNIDDDPHTATGAGFDTGKIESGEQVTITFNEPGAFPYSCSFHPIMTGMVEVRDETGQVPAGSVASPDASPQASPASSQRDEVSIVNVAFDPLELRVPVGTTVVWTNNESIPHTVTASDESFGSDTLQLGDTFSHKFTSAGTFDYFCAVHANMDARVIVTD